MIPQFPSFVPEFPGVEEPGAASRSEAQAARELFGNLQAGKLIIDKMTRNGEAQRSQKSGEFVEKGAEVYANA